MADEALAIPLLDTGLAIVRRFLRQQPIFTADRGHIHHRLLDRGLTPRKVALLLYACCALGAIASLAMMNQNYNAFVIIAFCAVTWIGVQHLGYVEFGLAGRMVIEGAFRRQLNAQLALKGFEQEIRATGNPDDCWSVLLKAAREFGFHEVYVELGDRVYEHKNGNEALNTWSIRVPLSNHDFIELGREFDVTGNSTAVAAFADMLRKTLRDLYATEIPESALHASASASIRG